MVMGRYRDPDDSLAWMLSMHEEDGLLARSGKDGIRKWDASGEGGFSGWATRWDLRGEQQGLCFGSSASEVPATLFWN